MADWGNVVTEYRRTIDVQSRTSMRFRIRLGTAVACMVLILTGSQALPDRQALFRAADHCVAGDYKTRSVPECVLMVNRTRPDGFVIVRADEGFAQFLLVPVRPIKGIEDKVLDAPDAPNYWLGAWRARWLLDVERRAALSALGLKEIPREDVALVVNSAASRSQDQLHIHIDCVREDVRNTLAGSEIGTAWSDIRLGERQRDFRVRYIADRALANVNIFALADDDLNRRGLAGSDHTIVLVGATHSGGAIGFYLLTRAVGNSEVALSSDRGRGEDLMDVHGGRNVTQDGCAILRAGRVQAD
jgi:CDP-diacylglycerol pyrophosphatase